PLRYLSPTLIPYTTLFRSFTIIHLDPSRKCVPSIRSKVSLFADVPSKIFATRSRHIGVIGILYNLTVGTPHNPTRPAIIPIGYIDRKSTRLNSSHVKISYA